MIEQTNQQISTSDHLTQYFKKFSDNPFEEIAGRVFLQETASQQFTQRPYLVGHKKYIKTKCGFTYSAVMSALFGHQFETDSKVSKIQQSNNQDCMTGFRDVVKENTKALQDKFKTCFFAYGFALHPTEINNQYSFKQFGGHAFVVLHTLDEKNEPRFRLIQSYAGMWTLKEYIDERLMDFDASQFDQFLKDVQQLTTADKWSTTLAEIGQKYFLFSPYFSNDSIIQPHIPLTIHYGQGSLDSVQAHAEEFEKIKQTDQFPQFVKAENFDVRKAFETTLPNGEGFFCRFVVPGFETQKYIDPVWIHKQPQ